MLLATPASGPGHLEPPSAGGRRPRRVGTGASVWDQGSVGLWSHLSGPNPLAGLSQTLEPRSAWEGALRLRTAPWPWSCLSRTHRQHGPGGQRRPRPAPGPMSPPCLQKLEPQRPPVEAGTPEATKRSREKAGTPPDLPQISPDWVLLARSWRGMLGGHTRLGARMSQPGRGPSLCQHLFLSSSSFATGPGGRPFPAKL